MKKSDTGTHADSWFGESGPGGDLLSTRHVRVPVRLKCRLELLQLNAREMGPLSPPLSA